MRRKTCIAMQTWHSTRPQTLSVRTTAADERRTMASTLVGTVASLGAGVDIGTPRARRVGSKVCLFVRSYSARVAGLLSSQWGCGQLGEGWAGVALVGGGVGLLLGKAGVWVSGRIAFVGSSA